jgi:hypothetical protein
MQQERTNSTKYNQIVTDKQQLIDKYSQDVIDLKRQLNDTLAELERVKAEYPL